MQSPRSGKISIAIYLGIAIIATGSLLVSCQKDIKLNTKTKKISYVLGQNIGKTFKSQDISVDSKILSRGILDGMSDRSELTQEEMRTVLIDFQKETMTKRKIKIEKEAKSNLKNGTKFLSKNKTKPGIVALESGLQYKILTEGSGKKSPKETDQVKVHYKGTLIDGTEFDSSFKRNAPATFQVNRVIKGWTEALQKMSVGDKWQLFIPAELAYGQRGSGGSIGPNATLIFEVELLEINPKKG